MQGNRRIAGIYTLLFRRYLTLDFFFNINGGELFLSYQNLIEVFY